MADRPTDKNAGERVMLAGLPVRLIRRRVRRVTLAVLPPFGEIRVTAPLTTPISELERIAAGKRAWLQNKTATFPRDPGRERRYCEGEYAMLWGWRLRLVPEIGAPGVTLRQNEMILSARDASPEKRAAALNAFYRAQVQTEAEKLLPVLSHMTGLSPAKLTVRKMARRWGTCYHKTGTIHLSLTLAEYPPACLSYVLLHELLHLRYPDHGRDFHAALDRYMPDNRTVAATLNRLHRISAAAWAPSPDE